jgi:hypothetical protein
LFRIVILNAEKALRFIFDTTQWPGQKGQEQGIMEHQPVSCAADSRLGWQDNP